MAINERIIYETKPPSDRTLEVDLLPNNRIRWRVLPEGEYGSGGNFRDEKERRNYMDTYAKRLGFNLPGRVYNEEPEVK